MTGMVPSILSAHISSLQIFINYRHFTWSASFLPANRFIWTSTKHTPLATGSRSLVIWKEYIYTAAWDGLVTWLCPGDLSHIRKEVMHDQSGADLTPRRLRLLPFMTPSLVALLCLTGEDGSIPTFGTITPVNKSFLGLRSSFWSEGCRLSRLFGCRHSAAPPPSLTASMLYNM